MPELAEVEAYRRLAESRALGRPIAVVAAPDAWYLKGGLTAPCSPPRRWSGAAWSGRNGGASCCCLPTSDGGPVLGLRFGMSGRLIVDGAAGVDDLWYGSKRDEPRWDRFALEFEDGGRLVMSDPRRLGGVTLDPGLSHLGPDALTITPAQLRLALAPGRGRRAAAADTAAGGTAARGTAAADAAVGGVGPDADTAAGGIAAGGTAAADAAVGGVGPASRMSLKGRLMDQSRLAGVGNLAADEILWRAGLDPTRPASSLDREPSCGACTATFAPPCRTSSTGAAPTPAS